MREALRAGEEELKTLRANVQQGIERRAQIEVDLARKQAELKYLDETSRKELNCPIEELAPADETAGERPTGVALLGDLRDGSAVLVAVAAGMSVALFGLTGQGVPQV